MDQRTFFLLRQWSGRAPTPEEQVREARSGDKDEAREMLERFCAHLESRQLAPEAVADYVATALRSILAGGEAQKALGLRTPGRPRQSRYLRKQLAARVYLLMAEGHTKEIATEWVAAKIGDELRCWQEIDRLISTGKSLEEARTAALQAFHLLEHSLMSRDQTAEWYNMAVTQDKAANCYEEFRPDIEQLLA